jgi:hypothetical protein
MHHGVHGDVIFKLRLVFCIRQIAVNQQIANFEEIGLFGKLINGIAAVTQDANVTINIGQLGLAGAGRGEARVIGEISGFGVEFPNVDYRRTNATLDLPVALSVSVTVWEVLEF